MYEQLFTDFIQILKPTKQPVTPRKIVIELITKQQVCESLGTEFALKCIIFHLFTGIMLGAWPCGTIVLLGELFGAESISQVYALLHTFLLKNGTSTENIRM